jgi:hypothetical protein
MSGLRIMCVGLCLAIGCTSQRGGHGPQPTAPIKAVPGCTDAGNVCAGECGGDQSGYTCCVPITPTAACA